MQRIAISGGPGGFVLSDEAADRLRALGHEDPEPLPRNDPDLVGVIDQFGERAGAPEPIVIGAPNRPIVVVDVPDGIDWVIDEYDGLEWVAERHRRWDSHGELQPGQRAQSAVRSSDVARAESLRGLTPSERAARNERLVHEAGRQRRQEK